MGRLAVLPLVWWCALFLAGIAASKSAALPAWIWLLGGGVFLVFIFFEKRAALRFFGRARLLRFSPLPLSALLLALCAGAALFQFSLPRPTAKDLLWYNGSRGVVVTGWVAESPRDSENNTSLKVEAQYLSLRAGQPPLEVGGRMIVQVPVGRLYRYGDRLELRGDLVAPPGGKEFSYREYLAIHEVYSWLARPEIIRLEGMEGSLILRLVFGLRERLRANIAAVLPPEEAGLLVGVLLGDESGLSPSTRDAFRETGTSHLLAVSGFNISILAALLGSAARRFMPRLWSLLPVTAGLILFSLMVGGQASVVRAAVMGCVAQVGLALGRRPAGGNALIFSAAVMSIFNPLILWDIGFQLSFAATFGILMWGEGLTSLASRISTRLLPPSLAEKAAAWLAEFLLITLAAQVFTLPVTTFHFQEFSWIGLLANPLVLPVQQLMMLLGGAAALAGLVFLPFGRLLAWLVWPLCAYTLACVRWLAGASRGTWQTGPVSALFVILYYAGALAATAFGSRLIAILRVHAGKAALALAGLLTLLIWRAYFSAPDGRLHLTRLDFNGDTAYFITSPTGSRILINGVSHPAETSAYLGRELFPQPLRLDGLILTNNQASDQNDLGRISPSILYDRLLILPSSGNDPTANPSGPSNGPEVIELRAGQQFDLGKGALLEVFQIEPGCADLSLVYNRLTVWLPTCRLQEGKPPALQEWSVISLAGDAPGKSEIKILGKLRSALVISAYSDPGLIGHPNWLTIPQNSVAFLESDGLSLEVSTSQP